MVKQFDASVVDSDIKQLGLENVEQLVALFFKSADEIKTDLIDAMKQSDFKKQAKLAHRMNGAAGNFGLQRLCALLARIETLASNSTRLTSSLLEQFQVEYDDAIAALGNYMAEQKASPQKASAN